jgi:hypothetical protein
VEEMGWFGEQVKECTTELKTVAVKYERERGREGGSKSQDQKHESPWGRREQTLKPFMVTVCFQEGDIGREGFFNPFPWYAPSWTKGGRRVISGERTKGWREGGGWF